MNTMSDQRGPPSLGWGLCSVLVSTRVWTVLAQVVAYRVSQSLAATGIAVVRSAPSCYSLEELRRLWILFVSGHTCQWYLSRIGLPSSVRSASGKSMTSTLMWRSQMEKGDLGCSWGTAGPERGLWYALLYYYVTRYPGVVSNSTSRLAWSSFSSAGLSRWRFTSVYEATVWVPAGRPLASLSVLPRFSGGWCIFYRYLPSLGVSSSSQGILGLTCPGDVCLSVLCRGGILWFSGHPPPTLFSPRAGGGTGGWDTRRRPLKVGLSGIHLISASFPAVPPFLKGFFKAGPALRPFLRAGGGTALVSFSFVLQLLLVRQVVPGCPTPPVLRPKTGLSLILFVGR